MNTKKQDHDLPDAVRRRRSFTGTFKSKYIQFLLPPPAV